MWLHAIFVTLQISRDDVRSLRRHTFTSDLSDLSPMPGRQGRSGALRFPTRCGPYPQVHRVSSGLAPGGPKREFGLDLMILRLNSPGLPA